MNAKWRKLMVMDAAADGSGGGAGGGGSPAGGNASLFTPSGGGGKAASGSGNAGDPPNPDSGKPAGAAGNGNAAAGNAPADWRSTLPKELQEDATLKKFTDIQGLAGAYLHAQKLIGKNKIVVPDENTTDEQWTEIFGRLGLPKELEKYDVKFEEGVSLDKTFVDEFRNIAHKAGILPKQAQALAAWFSGKNKGAEGEVKKQMEGRFKSMTENLNKEWGDAFQLNVQRTNKMLEEFGGEELMNHFNNLGLGSDEKTFRFLAKVAEKMYKEDKIVGQHGGAGQPQTPTEIRSKINEILGNPQHPYRLKDHPNHKAAVKEVQDLHNSLYKAE